MLKIGLTGGIGSGKTVVSDMFGNLGVPVIDTDLIARELVTPDSTALGDVVAAFGKEVLTSGGELNRRRLGQAVFSDLRNRERLEAILHPRIRTEVLARLEQINASYCVLVVPLLIETDFNRLVDKVLVVDAPDDKRIGWVMKRSGLSHDEVQNVIDSQTSRAKRLEAADCVIDNDGSIDDLETKVISLHTMIITELEQI